MANAPQRPLKKTEAPDPHRSYERAHPKDEGGMGRLDNRGIKKDGEPFASPAPDRAFDAVANRKHPSRKAAGADDV
jgi:hypothetical protein